jgi:hypothetical protein
MMACDLGADQTVGHIAAWLLCHRCRARPNPVELVDRSQADAPGFVGGGGVYQVRLIGLPALQFHIPGVVLGAWK